MKIISEGKLSMKLPTAQFECQKCGCRFECNELDLKRNSALSGTYVPCPNCGHPIGAWLKTFQEKGIE